MKLLRSSSIMTILSIVTISSIALAQADSPRLSQAFDRRQRAGNPEKAEPNQAAATQSAPNQRTAMPAAPTPAVPGYSHYRLVDLGTLGGPNASQVFPAVTMNSRGDVIAQSGTATPDPFPPDQWIQDGYIWHGILSNANGVVRDLGGIGGNMSLPDWITENGLITGFGENGLIDELVDFPQFRALFWDNHGGLFDLGTLGGKSSTGNAVNNKGQVVGFATNATSENPDVASFFNGGLPAAQQVRAFLWERGAMRDLGTLGGNNAGAIAINDAGDISGFSATDTIVNDTTGLPTTHPFIWKKARMTDLGTLGGTFAATGSMANGPWGQVINEHGQVAGTSFLAGDGKWHAFLWDGRMIDLGTLGGNLSDAFAINDKGQVVGRARTTNISGSHHPFLWEKGHMNDLGVPAPCTRGTATNINSGGKVVGGLGGCGSDPNELGFFRAFVWEKGRPVVDLNTLIDPPSDILVDEASFINDHGEIIGGGILPSGETRAVLLVPIPGH